MVASDGLAILRFPRQVLYGRGSATLVGRVAAEFGSHAFVCLDPHLPALVSGAVLESLAASGLTVATFNEPAGSSTLDLIEHAVDVALPAQPDVVVAIGGGTTMDLGKLVSLRLRWPGPISRYYGEQKVPGPCAPLIALPTTAGTGSEVSTNAIVSDPALSLKAVVGSRHLIPAAAICDPELTLSCPPNVTAFAGMDALVNAIESYTSPWRTTSPADLVDQIVVGNSVLTESYALQAVTLVGRSLARAVEAGQDVAARSDLLLGSLTAGLAYSQSGTGAVHALDYPVEGAAHVPHGLGVGLLLPYVMQYNRSALVPKFAQMASAVGAAPASEPPEAAADRLIDWVDSLKDRVGIPKTLPEIGIERDQLAALAEQASGVQRLLRNNGRPIDLAGLQAILEAAWTGDRGRLARS